MSSLTRKIQVRLFEQMGYPRPFKMVKKDTGKLKDGLPEKVEVPEDLPWPRVFPKGFLAEQNRKEKAARKAETNGN